MQLRANIYLGMLGFVTLFALLLAMVARWYLLPAMAAYRAADEAGKERISATSSLVMVLLLVVLSIGLWATWRLTRTRPRVKSNATNYSDAWSEAGKRMQVPPQEQE